MAATSNAHFAWLLLTNTVTIQTSAPTITGQVNRFEMDISSSNLAKNVVLVTRLNDAHFSDNNFDLLPGQPRHVAIAYPGTKAELQNELHLFTLVNSY